MKNKKSAPNVIHYLQIVSNVMYKQKNYHYKGMEDLILKVGQVFLPSPTASVKKMKMGQCFRNAVITGHELDGSWKYTEGFALSRGLIPMYHSWLSKDGIAIDPTWQTDGIEYVGSPVDYKLMNLILLEKQTYGLMDDFKNGFPILKEKFNEPKLINLYQSLLDKS